MRLAVVGSLCSLDLVLANAIAEQGASVTVLRHASEMATVADELELLDHLSRANVQPFSRGVELLLRLREFDFVYSYTAAIGRYTSRFVWAYPALRRLGWPAYLNVCTGSDITELAHGTSREARVVRTTMRHAWINNVSNVPAALRGASRLGLRNVTAFPGVFFAGHRPASEGPVFRRSDDEFLLLHPTHLDWGLADTQTGRQSTKGNDRFLSALAELVAESERPVHAVLLDRGPDRHAARDLVRDLGLEHAVTFSPPMSRAVLFRAMREADVVVDQFDVGALGGIAWEAMTVGTPVVTWLQPAANRIYFDVPTPVLNARETPEILEQLRLASDPVWLAQRAADVREWIAPRSNSAFISRYLVYAAIATGSSPIDLGWDNLD
jgi:glycosyltransferase involved in cell wall biosynthesis